MRKDITERAGPRWTLLPAAVAASVLWAVGGAAHGSEHGAAAAGGHGEAAAVAHDPNAPHTFDLGEFDLRNFRPTHNEIANIRFSVQVALAPGAHPAAATLEVWKHSMRDQAITAVRSAAPSDLSDPKLQRVQRILLLRIKRLPLPEEVIGVYLTDFAVSSG
jgi:hypothetical protein